MAVPDVPNIVIHEQARAAAHALVDGFDGLLGDLVSGHVYRCNALPAPPNAPGVYLFADGTDVMHVGRTRNLQTRRRNQTSPTAGRNVATFAFLLARLRATAVHNDLPSGREALEAHPLFEPFFAQARADVRAMDFRCVVVEDHAQQAVFEVFASIALNSPHNSWETH